MNLATNLLNTLVKDNPFNPGSAGLVIRLGDWSATIHSHSEALIAELKDYFVPVLGDVHPLNHIDIHALQTEPPQALYDLPWQDWQREPGKSGRKEAIYDFIDDTQQRLILKVKTGLIFWQNAQTPYAFGNLEAHPNQIINFVLNQYMNHLLNQAWLIGHCSGLQLQDRGIAIAGVSGGGKSTLMLKLLDQAQGFISNDRLFFKQQNQQIIMRGLPKQPRINPGTILNNPKLHGLIHDHQPYLAMPDNALRQLEEKYDAPVHQLYDGVDYQVEAPLNQIYLLNWQLDSDQATQVTPIKLAERTDLLRGLMKTPGAFYQDAQQAFLANGNQPDPQAYLSLLQNVRCFEITGKLNFEAAAAIILSMR